MTTADDLASDYLRRLTTLAADLPADLREDVLADVRSHLDEARSGAPTEGAFREMLERLGTPEAIVAEARAELAGAGRPGMAGPGPSGFEASAPVVGGSGARGIDTTAVLLVLLGGLLLLPILGLFALTVWIVGIVMVWVSPTWTVGEKLLATLVWPGGLLLPAVLGLFPMGFVLPPWLGLLLLAVLVAAPIAVGVLLLRRARARAA